MKLEHTDRQLLEGLFRLCELQKPADNWHPHRRLLNRLLNSTVEEDALRAERVQLQDENLGLREDLKKVDDLHKLVDSLTGAVEKLSERYVDMTERYAKLSTNLHERIDKVAEIIGERVSGLVDEIAAVRDSAKRAHERLDGNPTGLRWTPEGALDGHEMSRADYPDLYAAMQKAAFPTGGATTAEAAAEAVLPVPQRGDRVRLEGAQSVGNTKIKDGWYEVLGQEAQSFQISFNSDGGAPSDTVGLGLFWIDNNHPGLKEVRHADQR